MLILVVIGIKLAHVDTAPKGKKTTSHLLFNLSLFRSTFLHTSGIVCLDCCLCYAVAWRSLCRELCAFLGRETHREEFKIHVDTTGKGSILHFAKRGAGLGLLGSRLSSDNLDYFFGNSV